MSNMFRYSRFDNFHGQISHQIDYFALDPFILRYEFLSVFEFIFANCSFQAVVQQVNQRIHTPFIAPSKQIREKFEPFKPTDDIVASCVEHAQSMLDVVDLLEKLQSILVDARLLLGYLDGFEH